MNRILVDADACPVRGEIIRVAGRLGCEVVLVSNGSRPIRPPEEGFVRQVIVAEGADAADDWIAGEASPADVVTTADIPLAARALEKGARALNWKGHDWTTDNIGGALAGREAARVMRESAEARGGPEHGPSAMTQADRSRFLEALDRAVHAARRGPVKIGTQIPRGLFTILLLAPILVACSRDAVDAAIIGSMTARQWSEIPTTLTRGINHSRDAPYDPDLSSLVQHGRAEF